MANSLNFDNPERQVKIKSKIIDIKRQSQTIDFLEDVVVESGDNSLTSQKMVVIFDENSDSGSAIKKVNAYDDVKIFANDFIATSNKGYYDPKKDIFVLQENVLVNNGMSVASGEHFLYDLKNEKGIFIGQKNEVEVAKDKLQKDGRVQIIINDDLEVLTNEQK